MTAPRDWKKLPLAGDGRSLVEASAGTGKTWTIAVLYLRLLLEEKLSPRRIIVSTFTNAAAAELAERLRGKLLWALAEAERFAAGDEADDDEAPDRAWLLARWRADADCRAQDAMRLQAALAEFDAAPVSTLHSLCSRILADHPFAAGALFRTRQMIDADELESAIAADLWRLVSQGSDDDALVQLARAAGIERKHIDKYVKDLLEPGVVVEGGSPDDVLAAIEDQVGDPAAWGGKLVEALEKPGALAAKGKLRRAWEALSEALLRDDDSVAEAIAGCHDTLLGAGSMTGVNKAGQDDPLVLKLVADSAAIADAVPLVALDLASSRPLRAFLAAAQSWCRDAMHARLDAANQSTFDQLLYSVHDALAPKGGARALADALFDEWPVALVDEFQDTDPVQFGILDAIYRDAERKPRGRLVMIGDPKQAIYRFRGGDVQAYERAKAKVPGADRLTLDTNHRSSRAYVEAVNQFYEATGGKLGPKDSQTSIGYEEVKSSARRDATPLLDARSGSPVEQPLVVHLADGEDGAGKGEAAALSACAGQIALALSDDGYVIGAGDGTHRLLEPGDIAVLLPGHAQISRLAGMLKARGIPCVATSQRSVFDTATARDLRVVLHATLHAEDPRAVRAALVTALWGGSLRQLQQLRADPAGWDQAASGFHRMQARLEHEGPLSVVGELLGRQAQRLLQTVEGERMLTDLRHLGELLQEAWEDLGGGERLLAWFARQMAGGSGSGDDAADARALRLESDAGRVKLMTLHASKGLEFPVVYLPLMWKHGGRSGGVQLLPGADSGEKYLVEGPAKGLVKAQEHEERYRILYVALTRAVHACHLFAVPGDSKAASQGAPLNALPLAKLWPEDGGAATRVARRQGWKLHEDATWERGEAGAAERSARPMPPRPAGPLPMRHSFTTLSGGGRRQVAEEDGAAEDEALVEALPAFAEAVDGAAVPQPGTGAVAAPAPVAATPHAELDALAPVAGTDFGNAVHDLFEHRRPGASPDEAAVRSALRTHGVRIREGDVDAVVAPLVRRLRTCLETPLGGPDSPRLIDLGEGDMRAELEFNYLLDGVSLRALREACEAHGEPGLVPARQQTLAGLMNGKIDLVFAHGGRFHVLDYKGNRLGDGIRQRLEDYAPAALETTMLATGYRLQALLYTVAVERYLRERLGDAYRRAKHLGDCWYLFVRAAGLSLADGTACGVWHHRFGDGLLEAVQAALGADWREAA